jgi:hypothetical protein
MLVKSPAAAAASDAEMLRVFQPEREPLSELRRLLGIVEEMARSRSVAPEPSVVLLAGAYVPGAEQSLELLPQVSGVLERALPGAQAMGLVVFVPPQIAGDREKMQAFEFFVRMEELIGQVPFLNIVFVHQLMPGLYGHLPDGKAIDQEICELLYRELIDEELDHTIQEVGYYSIRNHTKVSGRKCCYSTAGAYQLVYPAPEALDHLKSRFQFELFQRGLMDIGAPTETELGAVQSRADEFVRQQASAMTRQLPETVDISDEAVNAPADSSQVGPWRALFEQKVNRVVGQEIAAADKALKPFEGCVRREVVAFFPSSPAYLAGVRHYVDALLGRRLQEGAAQASGVVLFEQLVCLSPFIESLADLFEAAVPRELLQDESALPLRAEERSSGQWLQKCVEALRSTIRQMPPGWASLLRFLASSFGSILSCLGRDPCDLTHARGLLAELTARFGEEAGRLLGLVDDIGQRLEAAERELRELKPRYGLLARLFTRRTEYLQERQALQELIENLGVELQALRAGLDAVYALFTTLVVRAVLPYVVRARVNQYFRDEVHEAAEDFSKFVTSIAEPVEEHWKRAAVISELARSTMGTVLSLPKLETLYARVLARRSMAEFAAGTLAFFPEQTPGTRDAKLSYQACQSLTDHYLAGPRSLLDRMADYSELLFSPIRRLDILDILEMDGKDEAARRLSAVVERTRSFLSFSPGMLPLVDRRQSMNTIYVVRTAGGDGSRLASDYKYLFEPQSLFLDSRDSDSIHVTCLLFGFPAFVIHALHEGRDLARAEEPALSRDLWPD